MKAKFKQPAAFLIIVLITSLLCLFLYQKDNKYSSGGLSAADGMLTVSAETLKQYPVSYLTDGWAFYPGHLLTPSDFAGRNPDRYFFYTSIGERTRFETAGIPENPHGSGSYFLRLRLPEKTRTYALELPEIFSAYKLYIGNRLVLQMGEPEPEHYRPRTQNRTVTFDASGKTSVLLAVSDYSHFYSGLVYPPAFGTLDGVSRSLGLRMGISLATQIPALLCAVLALYLGLKVRRRDAMLFSLLCLAMCGTSSYFLVHTAFALPIFPWYGIEVFSGFLFSFLVVLLHNYICEPSPLIRRISAWTAAAFSVLSLCYGLSGARLTVSAMKSFSSAVFLFKLALSLYLLTTALLAIKDRRERAAPLYYASVMYATVFLWDRLLPDFEPILGGWFPEWGSLIITSAIGYTLWRDIVETYQTSLALAAQKCQMEHQLNMQLEYARQIQKGEQENRQLIHDFRHHLQTVRGMAAQAEDPKSTKESLGRLRSYLSQVSENTVSSSASHSGDLCANSAVDAILQYYRSAAAEQEIRTEFKVFLPEELLLSDMALCSLLGNLLENGLEACRLDKRMDRYLLLSTRISGHTFYLLVENSYDGDFRQKNGRFLSRKREHIQFGIGLESVRDTVVNHGGTIDIYPMESKFRVGISLPLQIHF